MSLRAVRKQEDRHPSLSQSKQEDKEKVEFMGLVISRRERPSRRAMKFL